MRDGKALTHTSSIFPQTPESHMFYKKYAPLLFIRWPERSHKIKSWEQSTCKIVWLLLCDIVISSS